jgi:hypothetical protein
VSDRQYEEISEEDRRYEDGKSAGLLDIVTIPMKKYRRSEYQVENHLIDDEYYSSKQGNVDWDDLSYAVDDVDELWINDHRSTMGVNDRVPLHLANSLGGSLLFISVQDIRIAVGSEYGNNKRKVRAHFTTGAVPTP